MERNKKSLMKATTKVQEMQEGSMAGYEAKQEKIR